MRNVHFVYISCYRYNCDRLVINLSRNSQRNSTGELDKDALNFNDKTYYVGFDANQGAELQGQMVLDYIKEMQHLWTVTVTA